MFDILLNGIIFSFSIKLISKQLNTGNPGNNAQNNK